MKLVPFLKSKSFLRQLIIMGIVMIILCFGLIKWIEVKTNHGEEIIVPDLTQMTLIQAKEKLKSLNLNYQINDTLSFNKKFLPNSIVEQNPNVGSKVKSGRKIYFKLNAAAYEMVEIPEFENLTLRQVLPMLISLGLKEGQITYRPYFAENVVLEIKHKGKTLNPGDTVMKTAKIDFVLGDGNDFFQERVQTNQSEDNEISIEIVE